MAITEMGFTPATGFRDATTYPNPTSGAECRDQLQDGLDQIKTYINDVLIAALNATAVGASGAEEIGYDNGYATIAAALDAILAAGTGSIPPDLTISTAKLIDLAVTVDKIAANTITEAKMANAMKKQAGGVAEYDTVSGHLLDTTTAHGAVSTATASKVVVRDANGRAKFSAPSDEDDVALKSNVTTVATNLTTHIADYTRNPGYVATGGNSTTYTCTLDPAITDYATGQQFIVVPHATNGASATLNLNGKGAKALKDTLGNACVAGTLLANQPYLFIYTGTSFFLASGGSGVIKSIQNISGTQDASTIETDIEITSVDTNKAIILANCGAVTASRVAQSALIKLTSATNARVSRNAHGSVAMDYSFSVVEFNSVKSMQYFEATSFAGAGPVDCDTDITAVDTAKSFIAYQVKQGVATSGYWIGHAASFLDADTVRVRLHTSLTTDWTAGVYVIEFY